MQEPIELIDSLTDVQSISLLKQLYRNIYKAVPYDQVIQNLPGQSNVVEELRSLDPEIQQNQLPPNDSVVVARQILRAFAQDPQLSKLLLSTWEDVKRDDRLVIETILAIGLVVNVTLFMAASDIEYKDGRLSFRKKKIDATTLKLVLEPVTELVKKFPVVSN